MDDRLYIGKIHILEWLRPSDAEKTGRDLHAIVQPIAVAANLPVDVTFRSIATKAEFLTWLRCVERDFIATGKLPVLQIETHGDKEGIGLSQGNGFDWPELMREFTPLNELTRLRLIVVLSACHGFWGLQMFQPSSRAGLLALIGPNRDMEPDELARAFRAFYGEMFRSGNGNASYMAMNDAVDSAKPTFAMINAEMAFKSVMIDFFEELCSPGAIERRVEAIADACVPASVRVPELDAIARAATRQLLSDHEARFAEFKEHFLFIDLFPENATRFPITYADLQKDGPP